MLVLDAHDPAGGGIDARARGGGQAVRVVLVLNKLGACLPPPCPPPLSLSFSDRPGTARECSRMAEAPPHYDPIAALPLRGLVPAHESPLALRRPTPPPSRGVQAEHSAEHHRRASSVSERLQKRLTKRIGPHSSTRVKSRVTKCCYRLCRCCANSQWRFHSNTHALRKSCWITTSLKRIRCPIRPFPPNGEAS